VVFIHFKTGDHEHVIASDLLNFVDFLLLFFDSTLFGLLSLFNFPELIILLLLLLGLYLILGDLSFDFVKALLMVLPTLDFLNLINTNSLSIWLK